MNWGLALPVQPAWPGNADNYSNSCCQPDLRSAYWGGQETIRSCRALISV